MDEIQDQERTFMVFTSVGYLYYSGETNKNTTKRAGKRGRGPKGVGTWCLLVKPVLSLACLRNYYDA